MVKLQSNEYLTMQVNLLHKTLTTKIHIKINIHKWNDF